VLLTAETPSIDVARVEGRRLRRDRALGASLGHPEDLHVNFVRPLGEGRVAVLTYEAGVEDVTPACGTGATAAAHVCARLGLVSLPARIRLLGGELVIGGGSSSMTMHGPVEYLRPATVWWEPQEMDSARPPEAVGAGNSVLTIP
jgi:diaminopimelate epimerase